MSRDHQPHQADATPFAPGVIEHWPRSRHRHQWLLELAVFVLTLIACTSVLTVWLFG